MAKGILSMKVRLGSWIRLTVPFSVNPNASWALDDEKGHGLESSLGYRVQSLHMRVQFDFSPVAVYFGRVLFRAQEVELWQLDF